MAKETDEAREAREAQEAFDAEDHGTGGAATDGKPGDLNSRRGGRKGRSVNSQLDTGGSEAPAGQEEEHDGQQAWDVDPSGKRMSLGSLIPRGKPVEYKTKVDGKSVVLRGGINDPSIEQVAVSALYTSKIEVAYTRDDRGQITKTIVTEHKTPRAINPASSEAGQLLLHGEPPAAASS